MTIEKHSIEAKDSWRSFINQQQQRQQQFEYEEHNEQQYNRRLKKKHDKKHQHYESEYEYNPKDLIKYEQEKEQAYLLEATKSEKHNRLRAEKAHKKRMKELYAHPLGIQKETSHGFMIDAGSTGSRIHLYEFAPRIITSHTDVEDAMAGKKLSFPTSSNSRWSDRLRPGIASFASIQDDNELQQSISEYLSPLLDFATLVLREKKEQFHTYPIFFRATAGMRTLPNHDRYRVLNAIRSLFNNSTFSPFYFENEYARVLSGEEEAVFGWAGTNFIMGNLVQDSQGSGTVINPRRTYGALDMGGASTQISFYEPNEDIMSGLFKLQIGQGKHWNIYAHSFLYFGINEARSRFHAQLLTGYNDTSRLILGVYNPCAPGNSKQEVRLNIHIDQDGKETWDTQAGISENGYYQGLLKNDNDTGNFDLCMDYTKQLLHLEDNAWCNFAHHGDCSFNGVAMPEMPRQSEHFGEFLAISNYFHVWEFLGLPKRSSLDQLYNKTKTVCSMNKSELLRFNEKNAKVSNDEVDDYCFRSAYIYNVLHNGYGFGDDEYITATDVINGQKVGWALGAMLYEINTFPWTYEKENNHKIDKNDDSSSSAVYYHSRSKRTIPGRHLESGFLVTMLLGIIMSLFGIFMIRKRRRNREQYLPLK